jgi:glycosyltransferase involved in cell wall biosynthesis
MTQPLVTVCVPTIGRTAMLAAALASLHAQTYPHLEILLLDNASEGEGRQILERYTDRDPRARILRCEPRRPMFANFNRGIRESSGEFVAFLFDDDVYLPQLIERQLAILVDHPSAGFAGSNYYLIDETGGVTGFPGLVPKTRVIRGRDYISGQISRTSMVIGTPGIMFRRTLIAAFPFDESLPVYGGDLIMRFRMAEVADVALTAEPLVQIRVHPNAQTSALTPTQSVLLRTHLLDDYIAEYAQRWPDDRAFISALRRGLIRSHLSVLLWDWIAIGDEAEAAERLSGLRAYPASRRLTPPLMILERLGLSARRRRAILAPLLRRLGRALPVSMDAHSPLR